MSTRTLPRLCIVHSHIHFARLDAFAKLHMHSIHMPYSFLLAILAVLHTAVQSVGAIHKLVDL